MFENRTITSRFLNVLTVAHLLTQRQMANCPKLEELECEKYVRRDGDDFW